LAYKLIRLFLKLFFRIFTRLDVKGMEYLPSTGGYIAAANHLGYMDVGIVYLLLNRRDIILIVAEKYRRYAFTRWLVKVLDCVWIDRFNADFHAVRTVLKRLHNGGVLVISPEGTRSKTGRLIEGKAGSGYMAAKAGVPVLPVAVAGTEDSRVFAQFLRFRRVPIRLRIGATFTLPPLAGRTDRDQALQGYADEIMCRIGALLPPEYRGVYADHPRLVELTRETP
jgi:1-acyl-sn-glycerol-3-phosphate acyltransferase